MKLKISLIALVLIIGLFIGSFVYVYYAELPIEKQLITKELPKDYFSDKSRL